MRVLGIDPGIGRMGWGIVEGNGNRIKPIAFDCFETSSKLLVPERLDAIYKEVNRLIKEYSPDCLSIEDLFFQNNAKTAFVVGQARGVVLLSASQGKLPISVYTPLQVKMAVTGYGRAEKAQVGKMIKTLLVLKEVPKPDDTADALAVALCHIFSGKISKLT